MALLFFDGFDSAETSVGNFGTGWGTRWTGNVTQWFAGVTTPTPRTGVKCAQGFGTPSGMYKTVSASGGFVAGVAVYMTGTPSAGNDFLEVREGTGIVHVALDTDGARRLRVKRGATVLATGTSVLNLNAWYYIELKGTVDDAAGSYEVHIDGVVEAALTASGVDTRNAGTGVWSNIAFLSPASSSWNIDDVYICDTSGPRNNTFLGPVKVETLLPQTDAVAAGSNNGLTPSTGTDHGALVDEAPANTTDYNASATVGAKDSYNYPALALTGAILGVQTNLFVAKSDTAARTVCAVVRTGGTDYDNVTAGSGTASAVVAPLTTFSYFVETREINPATGVAWTPSDVNAIEVGMKVVA
jgi:hypothetical protein